MTAFRASFDSEAAVSGPHRPSLLDLARQGNLQALTWWLTSLLAPQGLRIQAKAMPNRGITLHLYFPRPASPEGLRRWRSPLIRSLSYRLWTLNSPVIYQVRLVAWRVGDRQPLWQQTIRINTPANLRERLQRTRHLQQTTRTRRRLKRAIVSGVATSSLVAGYWLTQLKMGGHAETASTPSASPPGAFPPAAQSFTPQLLALIQPLMPPPRRIYSSAEVPEPFQGTVISTIETPGPEKVVALTFDDGPWPETTEQILAILTRFDVKATFFMTGRQVEQFPDLARRIAAEGHAIGNHSWNHPMGEVDDRTAVREVEGTTRLIQQVTGIRTALYRPPGGNLENRLTAYALAKDYAVMMWSADSEDYYVAAPLIVDKVLRQARSGGIVLLHDGGGDQMTTVEALPQILTTLSRQGYRFVTVPELLHLGAPESTDAAETDGFEQ